MTDASRRESVVAKDPTAEEIKQFYRDMLLIRRFEEKAGQLYGMGLIGGFCHLYIGQEAVVVGVQSVAKEGTDSVITSYRDHAHMLACGMEPRGVMAELTGRATGYARGKGGSMHMFSSEKGFFGGHGVVGAQIPIGAGLGFYHKYVGDGGISFVYLGDGAVNQGQFYESLNMASLWRLPVVFIIENNKYGMGTDIKRAAAGGELYRRGQGFGVPGDMVDGMDVLAIREAAARAAGNARAGEGPYILEAKTYRYRGHSMSDPANYRSKEEVASMRGDHDAINSLKAKMLETGVLDEDGFKAIDKEIKAVVADATEFAKTSPEPDARELFTDILV